MTNDVWGCIKFQQMDLNVLTFMDRCCLHYFDIRVRKRKILRLIIYHSYNCKYQKLFISIIYLTIKTYLCLLIFIY